MVVTRKGCQMICMQMQRISIQLGEGVERLSNRGLACSLRPRFPSVYSRAFSNTSVISRNNEVYPLVSKQQIMPRQDGEDDFQPSLKCKTKQKVYYFNKPKKLLTEDAENYLNSLKKAYPQLVDFDNEKVVKYLEYMSSFGFRISKAAEMAIKYPPVVDHYDLWLMDSLKAWQKLGFSDRQQKKILAHYPELLEFPYQSITRRAEFLKSYFTSDDLLKLIENNVSVICEHKNVVERKFVYLMTGASHTSESIAKSTAVSHSLDKIMTRHEFLIRAGLFEVIPSQKFFKVMEKINQKVSTAPGGKKFREKYFTPNEVVCLKDELFIKVCTNNLLTVNDLVAFEEAYRTERESNPDTEMSLFDSIDNEGQTDVNEDENEDETDDNITLRNSSGHFTELENQDVYF